MSNKNDKKICPKCIKNVKEDQLFVEENNTTYHLSCYNYIKSKEKENIDR